jgi:hypothetical protein
MTDPLSASAPVRLHAELLAAAVDIADAIACAGTGATAIDQQLNRLETLTSASFSAGMPAIAASAALLRAEIATALVRGSQGEDLARQAVQDAFSALCKMVTLPPSQASSQRVVSTFTPETVSLLVAAAVRVSYSQLCAAAVIQPP